MDPATVKRFRQLPVANVSDACPHDGGRPAPAPVARRRPLAGPALTVKTRPGDNLMIHKALLMAEPGDVIVVDAGGDSHNALFGELMLSHAIQVGVAGVVIDGAVRDSAWIRPTLSRLRRGRDASRPVQGRPRRDQRADLHRRHGDPPGDLIIGDDDGLLCVPFEETEAIYAAAKAKADTEARTLENTEAGKLDPKTWVDEALRRLGCEGV